MAPDVAQLLDRIEITELSHRYATALDRFDLDGLLAPFSEDIVFDCRPVGLEEFKGKAALKEFFVHNIEAMADQIHLFGNQIVEFDGADEAHGSNYLVQDGHAKNGARIQTWALSNDRYVRTADGWRIAQRIVSPLLPPQLEGYYTD
jgi:ketosteroid isomerase-like protein